MRMMRRQQIVPVVNRTVHPLQGMDDGIPVVVPPGYRNIGTTDEPHFIGAGTNGQPHVEHLPEATANRLINQNKKPGSVNPDDTLDAIFLIGVSGRDDISPVDYVPDPNAEMIDRSMLEGDAAKKAVRIYGRPPRRSRREREMAAGLVAEPAGVINTTRSFNDSPGGDQFRAPDA